MVRNGNALLWPVKRGHTHCPIVEPIEHKVREHGVSHGLAEVGYDIRLKQDVWFWPAGYAHETSRSLVRPECFAMDNRDEGHHGRFCIASAIEEFDMPNDLMGIVHDKSTWARRGLSVFNTVVEPGWKGYLTLELVYHGQQDLYIPAGSGIAQVIFHELAEPARYEGKYQDQEDRPVEAKHG